MTRSSKSIIRRLRYIDINNTKIWPLNNWLIDSLDTPNCQLLCPRLPLAKQSSVRIAVTLQYKQRWAMLLYYHFWCLQCLARRNCSTGCIGFLWSIAIACMNLRQFCLYGWRVVISHSRIAWLSCCINNRTTATMIFCYYMQWTSLYWSLFRSSRTRRTLYVVKQEITVAASKSAVTDRTSFSNEKTICSVSNFTPKPQISV